MKVGELKKGMLVKPSGDQEWFASFPLYSNQGGGHIEPDAGPLWVHVRIKPKTRFPGWKLDFKQSRMAVYLGTKKDLGINCKWTDRFLFIDGQIFGVDPHAWRRISPVV
tara:strand:- start:73 stop:399 length:327 start_codon:yes stop_codon:yes gene_type:complete